jgi:hypothetical protein
MGVMPPPDPTKLEMDFTESSFFKLSGGKRHLPTPAEVRVSLIQKNVVRFENLNLLVKFGDNVKVAEAQSQWALRRAIGDKVPIPEVYGWRVDQGQVFIYMQLIPGPTLKQGWHSLNDSDKEAVCHQLRQIIDSLRQVKQDAPNPFIGMLQNCSGISGYLSDTYRIS